MKSCESPAGRTLPAGKGAVDAAVGKEYVKGSQSNVQ